MEFFTEKDSIVRAIWAKSDTILFIFAGAAAEFSLNKAVEWLYYTGKLPADPLGRLFSTVEYAHKIIFSERAEAYKAIDKIASIHAGLEKQRQVNIPDWAYRDVLYMLIYYSVAAFELLERKLSDVEKEAIFSVFYQVGDRMGLKDLPVNYLQWTVSRQYHIGHDLVKSRYTIDLFLQYKKHLGFTRYQILLGAQRALMPADVRNLLGFKKAVWFSTALQLYKRCRNSKFGNMLKTLLLPNNFRMQIKALDVK